MISLRVDIARKAIIRSAERNGFCVNLHGRSHRMSAASIGGTPSKTHYSFLEAAPELRNTLGYVRLAYHVQAGRPQKWARVPMELNPSEHSVSRISQGRRNAATVVLRQRSLVAPRPLSFAVKRYTSSNRDVWPSDQSVFVEMRSVMRRVGGAEICCKELRRA
jgi:hypothetical protein